MKMTKPKMTRILSPEHQASTTDNGQIRCQALELGHFYFLTKRVYQCSSEASDVLRMWDDEDRTLNQLPVCQYHKEDWLKHFGGEFNDKGEIEPVDMH